MPESGSPSSFLLHCLRGDASSVPSGPDWNWEQFIRVASAESLLPTIYGLLQRQSLLSALPEEIREFFFASRELNRDRNRAIFNRIEALASALNEVGLEPLLLKGAAYLLCGVYDDEADRFLVDIDMLLEKDKIPQALKVLDEQGYSFERLDPIDHATNHSYAVFSRSDSMTVDLHQIVGLGASSDVLPSSEIVARSELRMIGQARVRVPAPVDLVTHHILHSQVHELYRDQIWTPLRSLYDFALLQRRFGPELDWNLIAARFRKHHLYASLVLYLRLARQTLKVPLRFSVGFGPVLILRWWHRELLRRMPAIRFVDPFWFYSAGIHPRTRRLRRILQEPGGVRYLLRKLFSVDFFLRLKTDLS